ncbi:phytanoyl-CoA dioxygenase family protein [Pseudoduganella lutea]|uniref:Phytanoyl-CoA dioxygenase n=1 Tax=Pseudoduganella lutea TaxID=321985 RepID=A0A4V0Z317_9BURK|nr:phytanoyl-CoA dioxygenase family protein [Pseudoduganella lutea]QBE61883.1 phytanoyl-CoA dioxygenase [Pseudoduganella lutea]
MARLTASQLDQHAADVRRDGITILREHFDPAMLRAWAAAFTPLLDAHLARTQDSNRGAARHYITLPLAGIFADPAVFADADILGIVDRLVGPEPVLCQLATDTPMRGSDYQPLHRDTPPLFPETGEETPAFQLAVNFPLCDVTLENGPFETTRATHLMPRQEALAGIEAGSIAVLPVPMRLGDVMIRDVRAIHRGTPNRTETPRPMVVLGYSRRWLLRPEVSIAVPRALLASLPERAAHLLRFNPVVDAAGDAVGETAAPAGERYQSFMH